MRTRLVMRLMTGSVDVGGGLHVPVRRVVLIGHYAVESGLVGHGVLLVVLVVEMVGLFRIEVGVGEVQPTRLELVNVLFVQLRIWLLGVEIDVHCIFMSALSSG